MKKSINENHLTGDKVISILISRFPTKFSKLTQEERLKKHARKFGDFAYDYDGKKIYLEGKNTTSKEGAGNQIRSDLYLITLLTYSKKTKNKNLKINKMFVVPPNDTFNFMHDKMKKGGRGQHTNDAIANSHLPSTFYSKYEVTEETLCKKIEEAHLKSENDLEAKRKLNEYKASEKEFIDKIKNIV
jgi:hypothetical protein